MKELCNITVTKSVKLSLALFKLHFSITCTYKKCVTVLGMK